VNCITSNDSAHSHPCVRNDAARRVAYLAARGVDPGMDGAEEITTSEELPADAASCDRASPRRLTIRDFLAHWGHTRRTGTVKALIGSVRPERVLRRVRRSRKGASKTRLRSFRSIRHLGTPRPFRAYGEGQDTEDVAEQASASARIGSLLPPEPVSVTPESSLLYARTVMLERQFSQLTLAGHCAANSDREASVASSGQNICGSKASEYPQATTRSLLNLLSCRHVPSTR
jgi:restriction system protein